jgi:type I restriction enzyme S subunit
MIDIRPRPIKDYCLGIFDGPHATPSEADDGPIFLGIKNITDDGRLNLSEIRHVSEQEFPKWTKRVTPQSGDVVFTYEATLHRYAIIPEGFRGCLGRRVALVRPDLSKVDSRFLLYYFLSFGWRRVVEGTVINGATVDRIPLEKFPDLPVRLPGLNVQRAIADVLSTYDDLIANNWRRIGLLEQSARLLFTEWFMRLRYPGHEHDKITNGVPTGWRKAKLRDLCESVDYGYTASAERDDVGPRFLRITDIVGQHINWDEVPYCLIDEQKRKKFELHEGDIVIARTGATVGYAKRINKQNPDAVFASYLVRLKPKSKVLGAMMSVFVESDDYKRYVTANVGGSAQPNANAQVLSNATLLVPKDSVGYSFAEMVEPLFTQTENLAAQIRGLAKARDLLLPRLMDGRISV